MVDTRDYKPHGIKFYDKATKREMMYAYPDDPRPAV